MTSDREDQLGFKPQKEIIYNKYLPYADRIDQESVEFLALIKANLAKAVQLREIRPGVVHWSNKLLVYIRLYGYKFSKDDHILFVKLFFELLTITDLEMKLKQKFSNVIVVLLKKKDLLSRDDLVLPWKPLYDLCESVFNSPYEVVGMEWLPHNIENAIKNLVNSCRVYFSVESTQEMLDEWRPLLCPFDTSMKVGMGYIEAFLPTSLPPQHHHQGFKLWLDEMLSLWDNCPNSPAWEQSLTELFSRLANDNIGYIDWEPWIPKIFTRILRSLSLPVGSKRFQVRHWNGSNYEIPTVATWIIAMMDNNNSVLEHISKFFKAVESYFHPSNYGKFSSKLQHLLYKLPHALVKRLHRERYRKPSWQTAVPESHKLTDAQLTTFVESLKPVVLTAIFTKRGYMDAATALQHLALIRPQIIIPPLLEKTYTALETLTEPHQLVATLSCVVSVIRPLVNNEQYPEGPSHVLPLLQMVLPGIDSNDFAKCLVTFQFISSALSTVPVVDCSPALFCRGDLTESEKELCSATAAFEDFICIFMDRCFTLIENSALEHTGRHDMHTAKIDPQEGMMEMGMASTFSFILTQSSPQLFQVALDKLFGYLRNKVFEIKVAGKIAASLCRVAAQVNAEVTLRKFVPHCSAKVLSLCEADEVQKEETLDNELLFNLQILSEIVRSNRGPIIEHRDQLVEVLKVTLGLRCVDGYHLACTLLLNMLRVLTLYYQREMCSIALGLDRPLEDYLPIRDWGRAGDIHDLNIKWEVPTPASTQLAKQLLQLFLEPQLEKLEQFAQGALDLSREDLLQSLKTVLASVSGASFLLPRWQKPVLADHMPESQVELGGRVDVMGPMGPRDPDLEGARERVAMTIHRVLGHMMGHCEDDTKSLFKIINIFRTLLTHNGLKKDEFDIRWKGFKYSKKVMQDKMHRKKRHIRRLLLDRVQLQHEMRLDMVNKMQPGLTQLDLMIALDLLRLATSSYSQVRNQAQQALFEEMKMFSKSVPSFLPHILASLQDKPEISHQQFKGALYVMMGNKEFNVLTSQNWASISQSWPAIIQAGHSEKPSIMKVIDHIARKITANYVHLSITCQVTDSCVACAKALMSTSSPAPSLPQPTDSELEESLVVLAQWNAKRLSHYTVLVESLVESVESGKLRWKFSQMAISFLTLMVRPDVPLAVSATRMFVSNLINDSLKIRKLCIQSVSAILKQQKRPHAKVDIDPRQQQEEEGQGSEVPGDRADNAWHQYHGDSIPTDSESWEKCIFVEKTHWGFYSWPKKLSVHAPPSQQPPLERSEEELSEGERVLHGYFGDAGFIDKLMNFLQLEEKKGQDKFRHKNFLLFKGLFRNFGDTCLPLLRPHLEKLAGDSQESHQRCLLEITAGLIRGSKLWDYPRLEKLWEFLTPLFKTGMAHLDVESLFNWGTCIATACESRDPRRIHWLMQLLMETPLSGEGGSFFDASRLYLLQGGLGQQEWRVPELLHDLLDYLTPHLTHSYKNVRDRIGNVLVNLFLYDLPGFPTRSPVRKDFVEKVLPLLEPLRPEATATSDGEEDEERKTAIKLCKTVMKWISGSLGRSYYSITSEMLQFLPLFAPLESNESDEELQKEAELTLAAMCQALLQPHELTAAIDALKQTVSGPSWRARRSVLLYLQVMVFQNYFLVDPASTLELRNLVLNLLTDDQLEVRLCAGTTLSGLLHCGFLKMDADMQAHFETLCKTRLPKRRSKVTVAAADPSLGLEALVQRHAGVIGLSACIQAYPYDVPEWMPQVLMDLGNHLNDPEPIEMTVKKTLSDFRRTHHDNWQEHKQQFTDDQLVVLTDLLVSPCYYA